MKFLYKILFKIDLNVNLNKYFKKIILHYVNTSKKNCRSKLILIY